MSEVYEIYSFDHNPNTEMVYVEAEVEDSIMSFGATQYEPAQWTHGRCSTTILWTEDQDGTPPPTKDSLMDYFKNRNPEWQLIIPENNDY